MSNRRLGLCVAPLLLFLVDISLTLWGQPADYWTGNYAAAREGSPEVRRVMQMHPALLFAMIAVWMGVIVLLVQLQPRLLAELFSVATSRLSQCFAFAVQPRLLAELFSVATVIAHTACASQWLGFHFAFAYQLTVATSIAAACLVVLALRSGHPEPTDREWRPTRIVSCFAACILLAIAYAVLYPH